MLVLVGLNHASAPVTVREKISFASGELEPALRRLVTCEDIRECMILSTCNRVEVLVRSTEPREAPLRIAKFLARERDVSSVELDHHLYRHVGLDAVRHVFEVACGLDSMIVGEPQILGQLKRAYQSARDAGSTGPILDHVLQQGFATAKRVRSETGIGHHAVSVAFAAVELARKIFGDLAGRSILVVGAGRMAELATRHLVANGVNKILVASRTFERAAEFARRFGGQAVPWEAVWGHLADVDVVVAGTAAPGIVLHRAEVQQASRARRSRPLFIIDIAVPRDVEPAVNEIDNVYLYDIDDLQGIVDDNLDERRQAAMEARRLIDARLQEYDHWHRTLQVAPTIVALRENLLGVSRAEVERFRRRLGRMNPEQAGAVDELARAIIQKVLHRPIRYLKEIADRGDAQEYAALYREIFGIPAEDDPAGPAPVRGAAAAVVEDET